VATFEKDCRNDFANGSRTSHTQTPGREAERPVEMFGEQLGRAALLPRRETAAVLSSGAGTRCVSVSHVRAEQETGNSRERARRAICGEWTEGSIISVNCVTLVDTHERIERPVLLTSASSVNASSMARGR